MQGNEDVGGGTSAGAMGKNHTGKSHTKEREENPRQRKIK
jgi:hypothetical protein